MDFLSMNVIIQNIFLNLQHDLKKWTALGFTYESSFQDSY